jgi:hypothetical protein
MHLGLTFVRQAMCYHSRDTRASQTRSLFQEAHLGHVFTTEDQDCDEYGYLSPLVNSESPPVQVSKFAV